MRRLGRQSRPHSSAWRESQNPRESFPGAHRYATDPTATARPAESGRLAALLHVRPDELLGVLLEHLVDLVEYRVDVIGQLLTALLALLGALLERLLLLLLLATPCGMPLASGVLGRHPNLRVAPVCRA